jgi:hypothetical protein
MGGELFPRFFSPLNSPYFLTAPVIPPKSTYCRLCLSLLVQDFGLSLHFFTKYFVNYSQKLEGDALRRLLVFK